MKLQNRRRKVPLWLWIIGGIVVLALIVPRSPDSAAQPSQAVPQQEVAPAWDSGKAERVAALFSGEGLSCIEASTGRSCAGEVEGVGSAELALNGERETLLLTSPDLAPTDLAPSLDLSSGPQLVAEGPLSVYYVAQVDTNSGPQFNIRNEASQQAFGQ